MSRLLSLTLLVALASGCAAVRPQAAFDDIEATLAGRTDARVIWATGAAEDAAARAAVDSLLADSLTADAAVQIALLNNRRLQATFEDLGLAQADLVQAGLLSNPVFGGRSLWPTEGGPPTLGVNVALEFLDVLYLPLRKRIARSAYAAARYRVAGAVLDLAAETRMAVVRAQADAARLAMQRRIVRNARAGYTASALLREAGNVPAVDVLAEQALYEQARLDELTAEGAMVESREALARLLGLSGPDADLVLAGPLPPVPAEGGLFVRAAEADGVPTAVVDLAAIERAAVEASLELAAARADIETAAQRAGLADIEGLVPEVEIGGEAERDDGDWKAGPEVGLVLPLFDQGQARSAAARGAVRRAQALYYATAVDVRSAARTLGQRLATTRRAALHYQTTVLPLRAALVQQTLLQYNAMQTGVFGLLDAQRQEAEAAARAVDALAAYWTTRADLDALLQGRLPALGARPPMSAASDSAAPERGH